ncbi:MAG: NEW3 domain-containing protein [Chloroflexota bacterium]
MRLKILLILFALLALAPLAARADEISLAQTVQASQTAVYQIALHNETAAGHTYTLALTGLPDDLTVAFTQGGPRLTQADVAANSYGQVEMKVEVPVETAVATYQAQFTATRDDGQTLTQPVLLNVENTYAIKIASQSLNMSAFSGQEFGFDVTAVNSGAAPLDNLALTVDAPAKWVVRTDPITVSTLEPGAETTIHAQVLVPSSQVTGDQTLQLALISDQTTSPDSSLTVRVQKSPTVLYAALGLMGLAIAAAIVYFRRKGRR